MKTIVNLIFLFLLASCAKSSEEAEHLPNADQFFTCEIAGVTGAATAPNDSLACYINGTRIILGGTATTNPDFFILAFNFSGARMPGTYPASVSNLYLNGKRYSSTEPQIQIKVSSFGSNGGKITGSYSGTISDSTGPHGVKGDFRLTIK
jgi:hypothetical protein